MDGVESKEPLRLLVATDLAPEAIPHLRFAARLGDAFDAHTTFFHAVLPRPLIVEAPLAPTETQADCVEHARATLRDVADGLGTKRPVHVAVAEAGDAREGTLSAAERVGADLLVLPTHGRTGLERALLGSTAEQIVRRAKLPVLLVTERMLDGVPLAEKEGGPILVATDLSPDAEPAHREAVALAKRLGRWVLLLSVLPAREPPPFGGGAPVAPQQTDPRVRVQQQLARMRQHAAALEAGVPVEVQAAIDDDVAVAITRVAETQRAVFVLLATHGRRGLSRIFRGSITEQVARHASVPVLCLPAATGEPASAADG